MRKSADRATKCLRLYPGRSVYLSKWASGVLDVTEVKTNSAPSRSSFTIVGRDLTRKVYWSYDVTASEPGAMFAGRARGGPVDFSESFRLETLSPGATEVTHTHEIEPSGMFRLIGPVFRLVWPRLMRDNLRNLKHLIEASPASAL